MAELLNKIIPNVMNKLPDFLAAIKDTLVMVRPGVMTVIFPATGIW